MTEKSPKGGASQGKSDSDLQLIEGGFLLGKGGSRPNDDRLYVPFPEGITKEIANDLVAVFSAESAGQESGAVAGAFNAMLDYSSYIDEIDGRWYLRLTPNNSIEKATGMKDGFKLALESRQKVKELFERSAVDNF